MGSWLFNTFDELFLNNLKKKKDSLQPKKIYCIVNNGSVKFFSPYF